MEQKMYDSLVNQYPVQKTLRFELIPQGKTLDYIQSRGIISEDEERAEQYKKLKKIIDDYHRAFIERALKNVKLEGLEEYYALYTSNNRSQDALDKMAENLRKQVSDCLHGENDEEIKKLFERMFKEELIKEDLITFVGKDEEKKTIIQSFNRFTTYLTGFHENRKNMYTSEAQTKFGHRLQYSVFEIDNSERFLKIVTAEIKAKFEPKFSDEDTVLRSMCG